MTAFPFFNTEGVENIITPGLLPEPAEQFTLWIISPFDGVSEVPKDSHSTSADAIVPTDVEEFPFTVLKLYVPGADTT